MHQTHVTGLERDPASAPAPLGPDAWLNGSVRLVGWSVAATVLLALVPGTLTGFERSAVGVLVLELLLVGLVLWTNARGRSELATFVLAVNLPLFATALMVITGRGLRDPAALLLPASLVFCGLLLDRRSLVVVTSLTIGCALGVLVADGRGLLPPPPAPTSFLQDLVDSTLILAVTSIGVRQVAGRLRKNHEQLRVQEAALRGSEARYRSLVDLGVDAILVVGPDGHILEANRRAIEITGHAREDLIGRCVQSLFSEEVLRRLPFQVDLVRQGRVVTGERTLTRSDDTALPIEMNTKQMPDGSMQTILRDLSERHQAEAERASLEERLRQAQKMEAVGRLAGGVAHDFNNLLTAITGSVTLALRDPTLPAGPGRWLTEIDKAAWRATALTRQLLAFSRQQVIVPRVVDLRSIVEAATSMLTRVIGEDVRVEVELPDQPCPAMVDPAQMEQVLLNLAANARDAMPGGGRLLLEVGEAAGSVYFSVSDTGIGMAESVKARLFEPFFTTKTGGTGLGLAMVYGAVQQNGGRIEVESRPERGACFRLLFPRASGEPAAAPAAGEPDTPGGSETILLVEDEAAVREVTASELESLGYRVIRCDSAEQALRVAAGHSGGLDLLLTDVVMPGMNSRELRARMAAARPGLRVLFTSGYGEDVIARHGVLHDGTRLIEKPYSRRALAQAVRAALDA